MIATTARAHGGPPAALGIVAADAGGHPDVVLLNEGLAVADEQGWTFYCPWLWGDASTAAGKIPLAASADGVDTWVVGEDDLYVVRGGELLPQSRPDATRASVIALAADDESVFALRLSDEGSELVRLSRVAQPAFFRSSRTWSSLALDLDDGRLLVSRVENGRELVRATLDRDGELLEEHRSTFDEPLAQVRLRPTPEGLYAISFDGQRHALWKWQDAAFALVLRSMEPVRGPQASADGSLWIAVDGALMRLTPEGFVPVGEPRRVTCLEQRGATPYACIGADLHRLGDDGLGTRLFELAGLWAPDPVRQPAARGQACEFQWLLYRSDLARAGLQPRDRVEPEAQPPAAGPGLDGGVRARRLSERGSCQVSVPGIPGRDGGGLIALAALGLLRRCAARGRRRVAASRSWTRSAPRSRPTHS